MICVYHKVGTFFYLRRDKLMKTTRVIQSRFIDGSDGHDSCAEFNQTMMELAELHPTFERNGNSFWIFFTVELNEPENIVEEHEMEGEKATCLDCPYLMRDLNRYGSIDGRKKWGTCGKTGNRTNIDSRACETYHSLAAKERRRF